MEPNIFPAGWDEERVRRVLEHYENQTDDEALAEDEAASEGGAVTEQTSPPVHA
jgi:hypothetical protein